MGGSNNGNGFTFRNRSCSKWHWSHDEDQLLLQLVEQHGARNWNFIASNIEGRTGKSCRLRWVNQLNPSVNKAPFDKDEEEKLLQLHQVHGNKWSTIAQFFTGRTDNQLKNHFHIMKARKNRLRLRVPFTGICPVQPSSSTLRPGSIIRPSWQKRGLISNPPSDLSRLRSAIMEAAGTSTRPLFGHSGSGIDNNCISSPLSTTRGSYGRCPPLNYSSSFYAFRGRYNESTAAAFRSVSGVDSHYAGGFNLGRNCDHQGTSNSQSTSSNFISAFPLEWNITSQRELKDETMKKNDHFIDFLGVEKSD